MSRIKKNSFPTVGFAIVFGLFLFFSSGAMTGALTYDRINSRGWADDYGWTMAAIFTLALSLIFGWVMSRGKKRRF